jgi:hypothetical protein
MDKVADTAGEVMAAAMAMKDIPQATEAAVMNMAAADTAEAEVETMADAEVGTVQAVQDILLVTEAKKAVMAEVLPLTAQEIPTGKTNKQ